MEVTKMIQQIDGSFSCVCPVIDQEFHHNIVKVAVDPRGDNRTYLHEKLSPICFLQRQIVKLSETGTETVRCSRELSL